MKKGLLVVMILLAGVLLAADRSIARLAEGRVAERIARDQRLSDPPEVDVHGFPFLTQAARRRFDRVTMSASDVRRGNLRFQRIDATLLDVRVEGAEQARVATAQLSGLITYAALTQALPDRRLRLSWAAPGMRVRGSVRILGATYAASALATFRVEGGALRIVPTKVTIDAGALDVGLPQGIGTQLSTRQPVDLPFGLQLRSVQARPEGLLVQAGGADVVLNQGLRANVK